MPEKTALQSKDKPKAMKKEKPPEVEAVVAKTEEAPRGVAPIENLRTMLNNPATIRQLEAALPKHITAAHMIRVGLTAVQRSPKLLECSSRSILGSMIEASELGLELSGILGHAYLVPRWNKNTNTKEAQFQLGYKGMMVLARRSGAVSVITAEVVYARDKFKVTKGLHPDLIHVPYDEDDERGEIVAAYATAKIDGADDPQFISLTRTEIDSYRARSPATKDGPWVTDYAAMCKKTAIRRLFTFLPCSVEAQEAVARDELRDLSIMQGDDFVDVHAEPVTDLDQLADKLGDGDQNDLPDGGE